MTPDFVTQTALDGRCKDCHTIAEGKRDVQLEKISASLAAVNRVEAAVKDLNTKVNNAYTPPWQFLLSKAESSFVGALLMLLAVLARPHF
ncbi:MAG: hypothetical protein ACYCZF_13765 [Anaerolineae bacterium]